MSRSDITENQSSYDKTNLGILTEYREKGEGMKETIGK